MAHHHHLHHTHHLTHQHPIEDMVGNSLQGTLKGLDKSDNFLQASYVLLSSIGNASTVAIDNKIEQAMDLVKSHLMFAVREEVEILKENIKELTEKNNLLMEKNTQLELENSILRNAAAPETLAQLASSSSTTQQQQQQQPPPTSSS